MMCEAARNSRHFIIVVFTFYVDVAVYVLFLSFACSSRHKSRRHGAVQPVHVSHG